MRTRTARARVKPPPPSPAPWQAEPPPSKGPVGGGIIHMIDPSFLKVVCDIERPSELVSNVPHAVGRLQERRFRFLLKGKAGGVGRGSRRKSARCGGGGAKALATNDDDDLRVIFRFCRALSSRPQNDFFPPGLSVELNGRRVLLPENSGPVDVTQYVHFGSRRTNRVSVVWRKQVTKYAMAIALTRKQTPVDLLRSLQAQPPIAKRDTLALIAKSFSDGDVDCQMVGGIRASLRCPLGLAVMRVPARSHRCNHLACFDALTFFCLNEFRPSWKCPLCSVQTRMDSLRVDEFFSEVLGSARLGDAQEIEVRADGSWAPVTTTTRSGVKEEASEDNVDDVEIVVCDDDV